MFRAVSLLVGLMLAAASATAQAEQYHGRSVKVVAGLFRTNHVQTVLSIQCRWNGPQA